MHLTRPSPRRGGFTLLEVSLVIGLILALTAILVPNFLREIKADELPRSARQLRSLLTLIRANAAFDGKRYRLRFPDPETDETDPMGGVNQPIIEREDDPVRHPEEFILVTAPWAIGTTFLGEVWCAQVRPGRPTIERLQDERDKLAEDIADSLREAFAEEEIEIQAERPPVLFEPDGSTDWVAFVLTSAPRNIDVRELEDEPRLELILEGYTGLAWMQRPFYQEELDLFEEKGWPAVLRQDFLSSRVLTEEDVLEVRESYLQGRDMKLSGSQLKPTDE
jgi:type II secretory pathway pseudopilin PulG